MPSSVRLLIGLSTVHFAIGAGAYLHFLITGGYEWINGYFHYGGAFFLIAMPCVEVAFSAWARAAFDSDEPMQLAWTMILLSAMLRCCGAGIAATATSPQLQRLGIVLGGPAALALLALGLARIVTLQHRFRLTRLNTLDYTLLACIAVISIRQAIEIGELLFRAHFHPTLAQATLWFSDPLLFLLLAEAVVIRRSALQIGSGLVARCWGAISLGVVFTSIGNLLTWLNRQAILPETLQPIAWYTWFAAATAFAIAPCFQVAASRQAYRFQPLWVGGDMAAFNAGSAERP